MTDPNQAPGFIDRVPSQDELVADAANRAAQIAELEMAQPIVAFREAMANSGVDLAPDAQPQVRPPYIPPKHQEAAPAVPHVPYEEPDSERVLSPAEHKALLEKMRQNGQL